jgi:hypothetical protein
MTTPIERAEHIYTATIWRYLDTPRRADPAVKQAIVDHIAYEIEQAVAERWMAVAERLPQPDQKALVVDRGDVHIATYELRRDDNHWFAADGYGSLLYYVTHWMPLPAPPKAEDTTHD